MELYITYRSEQDSGNGFEISGVFDNRTSARNWVESEGNGQKILKTSSGPIDWNAMQH